MSNRHRGEGPGVEVTLPITPMLDMSFQLLFFFMATFNPTDPEGAQALAVAKEAKQQEEKPKEKKATPAKNPDMIDPMKGETPPDEKIEQDVDLRLVIKKKKQGENSVELKDGSAPPIQVAELSTIERTTDGKEKKKFNEDLIKHLSGKLKQRKKDAEDAAKAEVEAKRGRGEKASYDEELKTQLAKLMKIRIQTQNDTPWGDVFDAMNICTTQGKALDLPVVPTLTTPEGWVPKVEPKQ